MGWLPLGGYCKISGMIDESMDKEAMAQPPKPYEFRSKPAGQRLLIMVGGVLFNFILALFVYSMVLFTWGDTFLPLKNMKMGMNYSETFQEVGFVDGDILLRADGVELERFNSDCFRKVVEAKEVTVLRQGQERTIAIPADMMQRCMREGKGFADPNRFQDLNRNTVRICQQHKVLHQKVLCEIDICHLTIRQVFQAKHHHGIRQHAPGRLVSVQNMRTAYIAVAVQQLIRGDV